MTTATNPITRIVDHYSQTVTPWVRVEYADGTQETMSPTAAALHLGTILQDPDAPAPAVNAALSAWRKVAGYEDADACTCGSADAAGMGAGVCRSCREELASDEIPY